VGIRLRDMIGGFIVLLALAGCASTPDANYSAYIEANARAQQQQAAQLATIADADACNGDATCVVAAKAFAAMAVQGAASRQGVSQYVRQRGAAENFGLALLGALPALGQTYAAIDAGRNSVRIAEVNAGREVAIVEALGGVTGRVADAFALLPASTYVGGDLISGTQHIGDTIGRDAIGGNQNIGDTRVGDDIRRDTIGGDRTDYGSGNRIGSPGPFTDTGNTGPRCSGIECQTTNPPPPKRKTWA
jgi:Tfp pilus assembly protein PilP